MVYAWLNPSTFELSIVNAGLEPVLLNRDGKCESIVPTGPVMGFDENAQYKETKIQLKKDDIIFFGSDGITEAGIGDLFGMERLSKLVTKHSHRNAKQIADEVIKAVSKYSANQTDDISLLVLTSNR